jgi:hypothetical protein
MEEKVAYTEGPRFEKVVKILIALDQVDGPGVGCEEEEEGEELRGSQQGVHHPDEQPYSPF